LPSCCSVSPGRQPGDVPGKTIENEAAVQSLFCSRHGRCRPPPRRGQGRQRP
jgi:hypothetical protein